MTSPSPSRRDVAGASRERSTPSARPGALPGLAALALALALALSACAPGETRLIDSARERLAKNDRKAATIQLKNVLQKNPDSAEARFLLGSVLQDSGEPVAAEIELRRARELGYPELAVVPVLAEAVLAQQHTAKLIHEFGELTLPDAQATAELKTTVARAHALDGSIEQAQAAVGQGLQAQPQYLPALLLRARLTALRDADAAMREVDAILAGAPGSAEAWLIKGNLLLRARPEPAEAVEAWRKALSIRGDLVEAHAALIGLSFAQRDLPAAQLQFEAMKKALPRHPQTVDFEGRIAFLRGDYQRARELFQVLLRAMPDKVSVLQSAGAVELKLGAPRQAEVLLSKAVALAPQAPGARHLLAQSYLRLGQGARALAALAPLLEQAKPDAETLTLAAQANLLAGDVKTSEALFARAARLKPDDPKIRTALALSHLAQGRVDSAFNELQAIASGDSGSTADMALIAAHLKRGELDAALKAIAVLERKQPDRATTAHLRGQVLLRRKDVAAARQSFDEALRRDAGFYPAAAALARLDLQDQQPDAAQARFERVLKADPRNSQALLAQAELAARRGAGRDEVARLLDNAVKASPGDPRLRLALIDHHLATRNAKAALAAAQAALLALPDDAELLDRLGRSQIATGDAQQAINTYTRLGTLQPRSEKGPLGLAEAHVARQEWSAAARQARRALELAPNSLPAQRVAISVALRERRDKDALDLARSVQTQRAAMAIGWLLEGEIHLARKRWDPAAVAFRQALTKRDPSPASARLHFALGEAGKATEADAFAARWQADHPDDLALAFYLGDVALLKGDLALAEQRYRAVLAQQPEHALALNNVAWLMIKRNQPGALALAERAARASPDQPVVLDTLALAYAQENQLAKAIEVQTRVVALAPEDPLMRLNLAKLHIRAGEKRQAKAELDRLARLGDGFSRQAEVAKLSQELGGR